MYLHSCIHTNIRYSTRSNSIAYPTMPKVEPRPSSSIYSDDCSMEHLIHQVSETKRVQELRTISVLMDENELLREKVLQYRLLRDEILNLVNSGVETLDYINRALRGFRQRTNAANKDWLAFWGIYECTSHGGCKPPKWV